MKTLRFKINLWIFLWILGPFTSYAGPEPAPTPPATNQVITEFEAGIASGFLEVAFNPTYAPKLASKWGGEITISHPMGPKDSHGNQYFSAGVNLMALNGGYFAGTVGATAKASFNIGKFVATPYVTAGAFKPFTTGNSTGDAANSTSVGLSAGAGTAIQVYQTPVTKALDVSLYGGMEYVSIYPGIQIYQAGVKIGYHFW